MKHLVTLVGKSNRFEWWSVSLLSDLVFQLSVVFGLIAIAPQKGKNYLLAITLFVVAAIAFWIAIAVSVRRLRDRGRPPWSLAFALIPIVGWIWCVIECGFLASPDRRKQEVIRRTVEGAKAQTDITSGR